MYLKYFSVMKLYLTDFLINENFEITTVMKHMVNQNETLVFMNVFIFVFNLNWDVKYVLLVGFWIFYAFFKVSLEYFSLWYIITCIIKFKHNNCTSVLLNPPFCKSSPSLMTENLKNNMKYKVTLMIRIKTAKPSFLNSSVN